MVIIIYSVRNNGGMNGSVQNNQDIGSEPKQRKEQHMVFMDLNSYIASVSERG